MQSLSDVLQKRPDVKVIVIVGYYQSGKSTFIASLADCTAETIDISAYTGYPAEDELAPISLSNDHVLFLLEWRGPRGLNGLYEQVGEALLGVVVMVDSSDPPTFTATKSIFQGLPPIPAVIAANVLDPLEAWPLDDLKRAFKLSPQDMIMICNATDHDSAASVILTLVKPMPETDFISQLKATMRQTNSGL
jgi:uncharacterized protein